MPKLDNNSVQKFGYNNFRGSAGRNFGDPVNDLDAVNKRTLDSAVAAIPANPVKATGAEITTGTDDDKFVTPKALADATVGKLGAAWTSWVPVITNLTVGSGTLTGAYVQIGKTVHFRLRFVYGSGSSVGGSLTLATFPVTPISYGARTPIGIADFVDASPTANYHGNIFSDGIIWVVNTAGTYSAFTSLSSSVPITWTTNDEIRISGTYEAA